MKLVRVSFPALCLLAAASVASARTYSNADLSGGFALSFESQDEDQYTDHSRITGVIVTDGAGAVVSGTRTVFVYRAEQGHHLFTQVQSASGTYVVRPDGTGTMTINWTPPLPPIPRNEAVMPWPADCSRLTWDPVETLHFAVTYDGFRFVNELHQTLVNDCPPPYDSANGAHPQGPLTVAGTATRQEMPAPEASFVMRPPQIRTR